MNILEFYQKFKVDPEFDENFYSITYPQTWSFELSTCRQHGLSEKHRLFYHYSIHGYKTNKQINFYNFLKNQTPINPDKIYNSKDIEEVLPPHKSFIESYEKNTASGKQITKDSKITVVALARNCGKMLQNSLDLIYSLDCKELNVFIFENDSTDNTREILQKNQTLHPSLEFSLNNLNLEDLRGSDELKTRIERLATYRNLCKDWVKNKHKDSDFVIVVDLDADLGFSVSGIYNSIFWLNSIQHAGGMGSYSAYFKGVQYSHYDYTTIRLNDWEKHEDCFHALQWFAKFHPLIGSNPVEFYSCHGGLAVYKSEAFCLGDYNNQLGIEHVAFHKSLRDQGWKMFFNPSNRFFTVFEP